MKHALLRRAGAPAARPIATAAVAPPVDTPPVDTAPADARPDANPTILQCAIGGCAIGTAGIAGIAFNAGDDAIGLIMAALTLGAVLFASVVRP